MAYPADTPAPPVVFVSYAWEGAAHERWVHEEFATRLQERDGCDVRLDVWHARPGDPLPAFMETAVRESRHVLVVCTPSYKAKTDGRRGGVGYEAGIMTGELFMGRPAPGKFIPVLRAGDPDDAIPSWLLGRFYIDLRGAPGTDRYERQYERLLATLYGYDPEAPPRGPAPDPTRFGRTRSPDAASGRPPGGERVGAGAGGAAAPAPAAARHVADGRRPAASPGSSAPAAPPGVPCVPRPLPPSLGARFVGRDAELQRLDVLLTRRAGRGPGAVALTGARTGALQGGGGVGKTRLALEYVHRFGARRFPGGLFWVDADADPAALEERQHAILTALDPAAPDMRAYRDAAGGRDLRRDLVAACAALPAERPALVVLDNLPEPAPGEARRPLEHWWPARAHTAVLATSRLDVARAGGGAVDAVPVDVLDPASARHLLTDGYGGRPRLTDADWDAITAWVGHLPLALTLLRDTLGTNALTPEALVAMARADRDVAAETDALADALREELGTDAVRGVRDAFALSYSRLAPAAQHAARLLAQLGPAPVPEAVVAALGAVFTPAARAALTGRAFVTALPAATPPLFGTMHRVLAAFLRACPAPGDDPAAEWRLAADALLAVMTPEACRDPARWPEVGACWPHAEALARRRAGVLTDAPDGAAPHAADTARAISLLLRGSELLLAQGAYTEAAAVGQCALAAAEGRLGPGHPATLASAHSLAETLWAQRDLAGARALFERALEALTRVLGPEHPDTLASADSLGGTLWSQGDLAGARALTESRAAALRRVREV